MFRYCETVRRRTRPFFGARAQAGHFERLRDPLDHLLAVGGGGLRQALGRHAAVADPAADRFPDLNVAVLEVGVELIDADAGGLSSELWQRHAILREERLHDLVERRFERFLGAARRLAQQETRGQRNPEKGKQT